MGNDGNFPALNLCVGLIWISF